MDGVDFQGSLQAVLVVTFGGVVEAGDFLGFIGGGSGVRVLGGAGGDGGPDVVEELLAFGLIALCLVGGEELAGLALAELAAGFDLFHIGEAGDFPVG